MRCLLEEADVTVFNLLVAGAAVACCSLGLAVEDALTQA